MYTYLASILLIEGVPLTLALFQVSREEDGILIILRPEASITTLEEVPVGVLRPSCFLVCTFCALLTLLDGLLIPLATHCLLPCLVLDSRPAENFCSGRTAGSSASDGHVSVPLEAIQTLFFELVVDFGLEPFTTSCLLA